MHAIASPLTPPSQVFQRVLKDEEELNEVHPDKPQQRRGDIVDGKHKLEGGGEGHSDSVAGVNLRTIQKLRDHADHSLEATRIRGAEAVEEEMLDMSALAREGGQQDMKHVRVLTVLSDMQSMSAQGASFEEEAPPGPYGSEEQKSGAVDDSEMVELERNLAKAGRHNTIKVPKGFQMNTLDKFEELGFELTGPGAKRRSKLTGDDDDASVASSPGSKTGKGRLPQLPQTYRVYKPPAPVAEHPTSVPPRFVKKPVLSREAADSYNKLNKQMKEWDDAGSKSSGHMLGANPFGGPEVGGGGGHGGQPELGRVRRQGPGGAHGQGGGRRR